MFTLIIRFLRNIIPLRIRSLPRRLWGGILDRRYGIQTEGWRYPENDRNGEVHMYQPTPYRLLWKIFKAIKFGQDDVLVDIGCGKGRVCCFFAYKVNNED